MGGAEAEPLGVGAPRAWSVGLDYFVLELLVLGLVFIPLEGVFPLRPHGVFRPGWQTDLKHFFISHAGVPAITLPCGRVPVPGGDLPLGLQLVGAFGQDEALLALADRLAALLQVGDMPRLP